MPETTGRTRPPGPTLKPLSAAPEAALPARVTLPTDLSGSLKYLEDAQLKRLQDAVALEINRRKQGASLQQTGLPQAAGTSSQSATLGNESNTPQDIPLAKANLIRASFKAGLKPAAIARNFRIPQSWVNRILSGAQKPKR
jgi:hypothetical protein